MNRIVQALLPRCDASTRMLLSSLGTSGLLHVLVGAALATWLGSMAPHLFPPRQGFNSIQLTARRAIVVEAVQAVPEISEPVVLETADAGRDPQPTTTIRRREPIAVALPELMLFESVESFASVSAIQPGLIRRTDSEPTPRASSQPPTLPRVAPAEPPLPTQVSAASSASEQDAGQLDAIPTPTYSPQPSYPPEALLQRLEGRVVLRVNIDADGRVAATSVLRSSGHSILDAAARKAVLQWRFDPPQRFGLAVQTEIAVPIRFRIEDE